ncbi:MAG: septal ring lytic transglycosylase RlpA family protein [Xanthobacteraceae bacterium]|jgi:rare lipoprotein A
MSSMIGVFDIIINAARVNARKLVAIAVMSVALAACTQAPVVSRSGFVGATRQASLQTNRHATEGYSATEKHITVPTGAAVGLASFYDEGSETASGEKFDPHELTAAHPTLPFGTRLRVTNVTNGRSVVVRVNDRGPFVSGRVVDVSRSAAQSLDMIGRGIAKVKIDVVQ